MQNIFKLLRVKQYIKNLFIFLPIFFGLQVFNPQSLWKVFITFVSFSLIASSVYIFNDILDKEHDQKHKVKKNRPIASGKISIKKAIFIMLFLLLFGMSLIIFIHNIGVLYLSISYFIVNIIYTLWLKKLPILDVFTIALFYVVRVLIGGLSANIEINFWIIIMTFLLALFLSFAKRRDDVLIMIKENRSVRKSVDGYNLRFMDSVLFITSSITLVSYIMYTVSQSTTELYNSNYIYITSLFVLLGIFRYLQITLVEEQSGAPTEVLYKDTLLQISILGWLLSFGIIMYF